MKGNSISWQTGTSTSQDDEESIFLTKELPRVPRLLPYALPRQPSAFSVKCPVVLSSFSPLLNWWVPGIGPHFLSLPVRLRGYLHFSIHRANYYCRLKFQILRALSRKQNNERFALQASTRALSPHQLPKADNPRAPAACWCWGVGCSRLAHLPLVNQEELCG
jgi:hypothetical protein